MIEQLRGVANSAAAAYPRALHLLESLFSVRLYLILADDPAYESLLLSFVNTMMELTAHNLSHRVETIFKVSLVVFICLFLLGGEGATVASTCQFVWSRAYLMSLCV